MLVFTLKTITKLRPYNQTQGLKSDTYQDRVSKDTKIYEILGGGNFLINF